MSWMAWTIPTGIFFAAIATALVILTVAELLWPTRLRRGFLPMATTRGDRFFISLLSTAFIQLIGLVLIPNMLVTASVIAVLWAGIVMRWG